MISKTRLTETEQNAIVGALYTAATTYQEAAERNLTVAADVKLAGHNDEGFKSLAAQFRGQALEARALAEKIEQTEIVTLIGSEG